ncbi:MAG: hypothetical protein WA914_00085 [Candidatus Macondimonas sp.]|jgi:hypothetical protein
MVKTHYLITFDPSAGPHFPDAVDLRQASGFAFQTRARDLIALKEIAAKAHHESERGATR